MFTILITLYKTTKQEKINKTELEIILWEMNKIICQLTETRVCKGYTGIDYNEKKSE